jgi:hypothetical protein
MSSRSEDANTRIRVRNLGPFALDGGPSGATMNLEA